MKDSVITKKKEKVNTDRPKPYKVILLNDDYTTMDFVIYILETIFQKSPSEAVSIMLEVHKKGAGVCGLFSREVAEAKVELVHKEANHAGFPLKSIIEMQ